VESRAAAAKFWQLHAGGHGAISAHLATLYYAQMLHLLKRRGIEKAEGQPARFAASIGLGKLAAPVAEFTRSIPSRAVRQCPRRSPRLKDLLERIRSAGRTRPARVTTLIL